MIARMNFAAAALHFSLSTVLLMGTASAIAQDSFGSPEPQQQQRPTQSPPPAQNGNFGNAPPQQQSQGTLPRNDGYGRNGGSDPASAEDMDFGIPPQSQLHDSNNPHAPTPLTIPGGKVISTRQLSQLITNPQSKALLFQVSRSQQTLPNAIAAGPASQGGSFNDETQRGFGEFLQRTVGGDQSRPLVFYCAGNHCWMSYNAALRAINLGYRNVIWYRGGLDAWMQAGLPTQPAS